MGKKVGDPNCEPGRPAGREGDAPPAPGRIAGWRLTGEGPQGYSLPPDADRGRGSHKPGPGPQPAT